MGILQDNRSPLLPGPPGHGTTDYQNELQRFQNLFQPSVKLIQKVRISSKVKRVYDAPKTPFQRVCESPHADRAQVAHLKKQLEWLDPFLLSEVIEKKRDRMNQMAHHRENAILASTQNKESNLQEKRLKPKKQNTENNRSE